MGKKRNKNRHSKRGAHHRAKGSSLTEESPYYQDYLNDPIAMLQDGRYELLLEWEARRDGYESVEAMLEEQRKEAAAKFEHLEDVLAADRQRMAEAGYPGVDACGGDDEYDGDWEYDFEERDLPEVPF